MSHHPEAGISQSPIMEYPIVEGSPSKLAKPPNSGTHIPYLSITSATEYAIHKAEEVRKALVSVYGVDDLIALPAHGGDWVEIIRTAITQALCDGYKAMKDGVPVAIDPSQPIVPLESTETPEDS